MGASFPLADLGSNALSLQVADSHSSRAAPASAPPRPSGRKGSAAGMSHEAEDDPVPAPGLASP